MNMRLLVIDTTGIQNYVFGSNRLRENIGASYLVSQATDEWVKSCITTCKKVNRHNLFSPLGEQGAWKIDASLRIESDGLDAEFIYSGGGNAVILCRDGGVSEAFRAHYTRYLMENAPGIQVVILEDEFDFSKLGELAQTLKSIMERKPQVKASRKRSTPTLGLGVSAACRSTGLPAEQYTEPIKGAGENEETAYPASAEVLAKTRAFDDANQRLLSLLPIDDPNNRYRFSYPYDLDNLGRSEGEHSYVAVVHADGDNIGSQLMELAQVQGKDNREYIEWWRKTSSTLDRVGTESLKQMLSRFLEMRIEGNKPTITHDNAFGEISRIEFQRDKRNKDTWFVPIRPIVFGGDDVTFICDSRIAHELTVQFIKAFESVASDEESGLKSLDFNNVTASAGIALVKSHYPFSRAYNLAEKLTKSAKTYKHEIEQTYGKVGGCLDWHFAMGGLLGSNEEIRRQHYQIPSGSLTLRPLTVGENPELDCRSWEIVREGIDCFQDIGRSDNDKALWSGKRNKVKMLRDALREGEESVKRFLTVYQPSDGKTKKLLPALNTASSFEYGGWADDYCGYFDALELADWFIPMEEREV